MKSELRKASTMILLGGLIFLAVSLGLMLGNPSLVFKVSYVVTWVTVVIGAILAYGIAYHIEKRPDPKKPKIQLRP